MITENDVRLIRQYLLALEEQREADASAIWDYLTQIRGLKLELKEVNGKPAIILLQYAKEPIFRMPASSTSRKVGLYEIPMEIPKELEKKIKVV